MNTKQAALFLFISIYIFTPSSVIAGTIFSAPSYIGLSEGLVGYWSFNDNDMAQSPSNTFAMDRSGNENNGILTNGPTRAIGKIGQGLSFDGGDDFVSVGDPASGVLDFGATDSFTYHAWVYVKTTGASQRILSKRNGTDSTVTGWDMIANPGGPVFAADVSDSSVEVSAINIVQTVTGSWFDVVVVIDRSTQTLTVWVNGIPGPPESITTVGSLASNNALEFGRRSGSANNLLNGPIDDVRIYNRALSGDEIKRLYNLGR